MKKLNSLSLCALLAPAITLGVGAALAQESDTSRQGAQTQQRGSSESAQQRAGPESAQVQRAAQSTPIPSMPADSIRGEDLIGAALMSRQDENFGPINDVIMNREGQVLAVIVGVGGFLGVGERDVAIAWDALERSVDEDGDVVYRVDMTDAALRAAPAFTLDVGAARSQEAGTSRRGAETQQQATTQQQAATPAVAENARAQERGAIESAQGQRAAQNTPIQSRPADAFSAKDLTGTALMSRQGQNFGSINDAIINQDGQILAVIVGVGGFLGLGQRDVAIGWDSLERSVDEHGDVVFHVDMTDAALRATPAYRND